MTLVKVLVMDALSDVLQTDTTLWAGGVIGIAVGLIVGLSAGLLIGVTHRRRRTAPGSRVDAADHRAAGSAASDAAKPIVRFLGAADTAHNTLLAVDQTVLADTELETALHASDPSIRGLAEAITTLAEIHNEVRVRAGNGTVDAAGMLLRHLTDTAADGVDDPEQFSETYQKRKADLIDAVRRKSVP